MSTVHQKNYLWLATLLIVAGVFMRVARHFDFIHLPPNFAPVSAVALFSAMYLPGRYRFVIPLSLMLVSDVVIGFDNWAITVAIYACFSLSVMLGRWLRSRYTPVRLTTATILGSIIFFLVTNAAVWMFTKMYSHNFSGLINSYVAGLPFFRNTVAGDLFYVGLMFGIYEAVMVYSRRRVIASSSASHG